MSVVVPAYNEEAGIAGPARDPAGRAWRPTSGPTRSSSSTTAARTAPSRCVEALADERPCACCATRSTAARASPFGAACSTPAVSCGCSATPTAAPRSPRCPRCCEAMEHADVVAGSRSAAGRPGRPPAAAAPPPRRLAVHRAHPHAPARAHQGRLLRLQALARQRRRGGLLAPAPDRLGLRRRGARAGARARLPGHRGRRRLGRPARLEAVDPPGADPRRARAARRPPQRARRSLHARAPDAVSGRSRRGRSPA